MRDFGAGNAISMGEDAISTVMTDGQESSSCPLLGWNDVTFGRPTRLTYEVLFIVTYSYIVTAQLAEYVCIYTWCLFDFLLQTAPSDKASIKEISQSRDFSTMSQPSTDIDDRKRRLDDGATDMPSTSGDQLNQFVSTREDESGNGIEGDARKRQKTATTRTIGPMLPPELRGRDDAANNVIDENQDKGSDIKGVMLPEQTRRADQTEEKDRVYGPTLPTTNSSGSPGGESSQKHEMAIDPAQQKQKTVYGPSMPPGFGEDDSASHAEKITSERQSDRPAVAGPTLPPGYNPDGSDEDEDEEDKPKYGLIYPSQRKKSPQSQAPATGTGASNNANGRDEWMLLPPENMDFSSRAVDPTKLRSRGFNTGRAAIASSAIAEQGGVTSKTWTETPEEKMRRLEAEVMGTTVPSTQPDRGLGPRDREKEERRRRRKEKEELKNYEERSRQIEEYNIANDRTKSLYEQHQELRRTGGHSKPHSSRSAYERERMDDRNDRGRDREGRHERGSERDHDRGHRHSRSRRSRDRHRDRSEERHRDADRDRRRDRHRRRHRHGERERDRDSEDKASLGYKGKEEDDPSSRPFDKEKDMRLGVTISNAQRRQLVNRASGFSSRFASGGFL